MQDRRDGLPALLCETDDEVLLAGEVVERGGPGDVSRPGDVVERGGVVPALRKRGERGVEQASPRVRLAPVPSACGRCCLLLFPRGRTAHPAILDFNLEID